MEIGRVDKEGQGMKSLSNRVLVELMLSALTGDDKFYEYRDELLRRLEELDEIKKCKDCPFCGQRQCMRGIK